MARSLSFYIEALAAQVHRKPGQNEHTLCWDKERLTPNVNGVDRSALLVVNYGERSIEQHNVGRGAHT